MADVFFVLELFIFIPFLVWIIYFLIFAIGSRLRSSRCKSPVDGFSRFLVIFPAYKEDAVIVDSVENFLKQNYPTDQYDVLVVADDLSKKTLDYLYSLPIQVLIPNYEKRSKAAAMKLAMSYHTSGQFDGVVILDADNHVKVDFLERINEVFDKEIGAIQAHRVAKNQRTDTAYLDGLSEEINNSIFRAGHNNIGLPAALSGSGMVFEIEWFRKTIAKIDAVGEDKELEYYLLKDKIYTTYLEKVLVYDEKVSKRDAMSNQRKRWIAAQIDVFLRLVREFFPLVQSRNWAMLDKLLQWSMPPRILILAWGPFWITFLYFVSLSMIMKWLVIYGLFFIALLLAIPNKYYRARTAWVLFKLPIVFYTILRSFIGLRSARTTFIHTPHGDAEENDNHRSPENIP